MVSLVAGDSVMFDDYTVSIVAEFTGFELAFGALLKLSLDSPGIVAHSFDHSAPPLASTRLQLAREAALAQTPC